MYIKFRRKAKKFYKENKKLVKIITLCFLVLIFIIVLYKSLFYSSQEKSIYGERLSNIKEYKLSKNDLVNYSSKIKKIDNVDDSKVLLKGRLLKYFVYVKKDITEEQMKEIANKSIELTLEKVKSYYDIEIFFGISQEDEVKYPLIGYKHKTKNDIVFVNM